MTESPCEAATRLAPSRRTETDVIVQKTNVMRRCAKSVDPAKCEKEFNAAAYHMEGDYYGMAAKDHTRHVARWTSLRERAEAAGIQIAGPGTVLARWINVVIAIATLGIITVSCAKCQGRQRKLDQIGWRGLLRFGRKPS